MKVRIDINREYEDTSVTIHAKQWTPELEKLVQQLQTHSEDKIRRMIGTKDEQSIILDPEQIDFVFAEQRKTYARLPHETIELKMKLFEAESMLKAHDFVRFSKSVVGNVNQIERFELAFNGNLRVHFKSGNKEYVSRKYVHEVKNKLIGGDTRDL